MANQDFMLREDFTIAESFRLPTFTFRLSESFIFDETTGAYTTGYENTFVPPFRADSAILSSKNSTQHDHTTAEPPD
jgi:hypothetical protein